MTPIPPNPMVRGAALRTQHRSTHSLALEKNASTYTLHPAVRGCRSTTPPTSIHSHTSHLPAADTPPKRRRRLSAEEWISPPRLTSTALHPVHSLSLCSPEQEKLICPQSTQPFLREEDKENISPLCTPNTAAQRTTVGEHVATTIRHQNSQFEAEDREGRAWMDRPGPPRSSRIEAIEIGSPRPKIVRFNSEQECCSPQGERFVEKVVDNEGRVHEVKATRRARREAVRETEVGVEERWANVMGQWDAKVAGLGKDGKLGRDC